MTIKVGIVMDPIGSINYKKDSSLAMLWAAQEKGWSLFYMEPKDLFQRDGTSFAHMTPPQVFKDPKQWYELGRTKEQPLHKLDVILMRQDPPFDLNFLYITHLLERAERMGTLIVNRARSIRDSNEKLFTTEFPNCTTPVLVTRSSQQIRDFVTEQGEVILKPLDGMGGASIFKVSPDDLNTSVIIETLTDHGARLTMAQKFIPEITEGDKRILLIDGRPIPYALARIPAKGELRGNLAAGGHGEGIPLSEHDYWICSQVGPELKKRGLIFVGIDIIGIYLTEINVTSPTCIRELDAQFDLDIAGDLMNTIESKLEAKKR
ncbi:MAG: glutathione synthase [Gammaproteobacteria bacterium]|nr:glutathione synthase [Gammaproteobacteria bacterium]